jgi:outer membrane usher protein FimD/PapC
MQKHLAETKGNFQLVDFTHNSQLLSAHRPSVVSLSTFMQGRVANGQVNLLGKVNEEATDEEFQAYWVESENAELAVASFLEAFTMVELTEKVAPVTDPTPAKKSKKAE